MQFVTSRSEALNRLNKYIENNISNYNTKRNFDFGVNDRSNVSCLSPYITHRLINEYETVKLVLKKYPFQKVDKFIQEIFMEKINTPDASFKKSHHTFIRRNIKN